jgi:hypothetical protein
MSVTLNVHMHMVKKLRTTVEAVLEIQIRSDSDFVARSRIFSGSQFGADLI